jgi:hypothetical protein
MGNRSGLGGTTLSLGRLPPREANTWGALHEWNEPQPVPQGAGRGRASARAQAEQAGDDICQRHATNEHQAGSGITMHAP